MTFVLLLLKLLMSSFLRSLELLTMLNNSQKSGHALDTMPSQDSHQVFGCVKKGEPCKRCLKQQNHCCQHEDQRPLPAQSTADLSPTQDLELHNGEVRKESAASSSGEKTNTGNNEDQRPTLQAESPQGCVEDPKTAAELTATLPNASCHKDGFVPGTSSLYMGTEPFAVKVSCLHFECDNLTPTNELCKGHLLAVFLNRGN